VEKGEDKIFTWLRSLPESERKSTLIYGLDADLVVISLAPDLHSFSYQAFTWAEKQANIKHLTFQH
jgi:5'-3' exonuclease